MMCAVYLQYPEESPLLDTIAIVVMRDCVRYISRNGSFLANFDKGSLVCTTSSVKLIVGQNSMFEDCRYSKVAVLHYYCSSGVMMVAHQ